MTLDAAWARRWIGEAAAQVAAAKDGLTELDRQIGDGDHGINLDRGLQAVLAKLDENPPGADGGPVAVGDVLSLVATTLMSTVGGASGPLYGTAFLRAARSAQRESLGASAVVAALEAALEGIEARGRARPGEKTMVDAWQPAVDAAVRAADDGGDAVAVLRAAAEAADAGASATVPLVATKGRASYLGERSAGHEDPGARSTALLLRAAVVAAEAS
ncbi:dihydroxyacetone kinase subunit L [Xylanimonas oleitrophica]|uniref:Dihydroxyacetone kinase subunit L n=1 Tax=Xylanimonas oleitrophica TaxID=2607479 RepID=A0A2W5YJI9_9MICO|nr:dihydroxyacetone kinase subunit DhaL [Xylanimonas oleitrophica]PZR55351.1 dihydroxyacetone kinase subunit L [Xylanimonas oleitrophica]